MVLAVTAKESDAGGNADGLISVTDYEGTTVTCTATHWARKVELNHPELVGRHEEVAEAIRDPHVVMQDRDYRDRKHHIRVLDSGRLLKVVAEYAYDPHGGTVTGRLITAFEQAHYAVATSRSTSTTGGELVSRTERAPRFNLEGFDHLLFSWDSGDDVAYLHIDGPRPAVTHEVDDAWYIRVDGKGEVVGLELHGLRRIFLSDPFFAQVFKPAIAELEQFTSRSFFDGGEDISAKGTIDQLPKTTHLLIFMIGQASAKYEARQRQENADAGRALLADRERAAV